MYRGRFAPTPSGPLHFGSLIAATASYLEARTQEGQWLVRIEDTDLQRNRKGTDQHILNTIEAFGFEWDEEITYQTQRSAFYDDALEQLHQQALTYYCDCSRKTIIAEGSIGEFGAIYANTCRHKSLSRRSDSATRLIVPDQMISFYDAHYGLYEQNLAKEVGDFHIVRRDQCYAYHLAAVVDDHLQGITHIVRGYDIIGSTPRHLYLQKCLGYSAPQYLHLPLATGADGHKLSKQTFASAIEPQEASKLIYLALTFLGQYPDKDLENSSIHDIWQWAIKHWRAEKIPKHKHIHFM